MTAGRWLSLVTLVLFSTLADARDKIQVVGAAPALEYFRSVAEHFALYWQQPVPSLEVTGTGGGFRLFCGGIGFEHPDIVVATRQMTPSERQQCAKHGVTEITEVEFGRDALVLVNAGSEPMIDLTKWQLFSGVAAKVVRGGRIVENRARTWTDVDSTLPASEILVMAPEPNTSAAIGFYDGAMVGGCMSFPEIAKLKVDERERVCRALRSDGRVVGAAKLEDQVFDWLAKNEYGLAAMSFSAHKANARGTALNRIEGIQPTDDTVGNGRYPLTTGKYVYFKGQHSQAIPGLQRLLYELTSERALGPDGYLAEKGMVPLDDIGRNKARDEALKFGL